jgi:hypothetical protein
MSHQSNLSLPSTTTSSQVNTPLFTHSIRAVDAHRKEDEYTQQNMERFSQQNSFGVSAHQDVKQACVPKGAVCLWAFTLTLGRTTT